MRLMSVMLGLLSMPLLAVASPVIVLALILLAPVVPGLAVFRRTSAKRSWNIAAYHSPHSLTWRWLINFSMPRSRDEGRWLGFWYHGDTIGFQVARCCLRFSTQSPMWYRDMIQREWDDQASRVNSIEALARDEYREGVSAGAAARQLCRSIGAYGMAPNLKRMLEDMLSDGNRASHDRYMILRAFEEVDPVAAQAARMESFRRINRIEDEVAQTFDVPAHAALN